MFVDLALAARLEAAQGWRATHYAHAALEFSPAEGGGVVMRNGAQVIYAGPDRPVNHAIGLGMTGPVAVADLEAVEEFFLARGAPVRVDLCPLADPTLVDLLRARRYVIDDQKTVLLQSLPAALPPPDPAIVITRAAVTDAELWLRTSARGFDASDTLNPQTLAILTPNFFAANASCYLATVNGVPVGSGGMYDHAGVVELGGASTLVAYRRQGIQSALVAHRLAEAYALGCDTAMVITTPGTISQRNMQRLGFAVAYTKTVVIRTME